MATMAKRRPKSVWTPARLKALRGNLHLTQAQAAACIRVGVRTWLGWENGETAPSPPLAFLLELLEAKIIRPESSH